MTWEEIIVKIRKQPKYADLVKFSYFDADLELNASRFKNSDEFSETLKIIQKYNSSPDLKLLDVGAGNGISSVAFAQLGFQVTALEPDKSNTIGSGAIRILKEKLKLQNLSVVDGWGEKLDFPDGNFDVVYVRQAMHHAHHLDNFIAECSRVLKNGGLLVTIRDHIIFDAEDKKWFLKMHPLHKFYGGENAFTEQEYSNAMTKAGLDIKLRLKFYDSVINYFPITEEQKQKLERGDVSDLLVPLQKKIGLLASLKPLQKLYFQYIKTDPKNPFDERRIPGRMYSFVAMKK